MDTALPPGLSIPGFLGYSDDPGIIPGWTQLYPPPLSEYPGIPGILGSSRDGHSSLPPCLSILGFLGYSDDPGIIPGWTQPISNHLVIGELMNRDDSNLIVTSHYYACCTYIYYSPFHISFLCVYVHVGIALRLVHAYILIIVCNN